MNQRADEVECDAEVILNEIMRDFEQLDRAIELALARLESTDGQNEIAIVTLRRAHNAAQKGAALAKKRDGAK